MVFQERASVSPLKTKGSTEFNVWATCAALLGILEALESDKLDVVILDRGLFDGLMWNDWQELAHRLRHEEAEAFRSFVLTDRWRTLVDVVFVLFCNPTDALDREHANQLTRKAGTIVNLPVLTQLRDLVLKTVDRYGEKFRKVIGVDTSGGAEGMFRTNMRIAQDTLAAFHDFLDEEVLCVPVHEVAEYLEPAGKMDALFTPEWPVFRELIVRCGRYVRRSAAEMSDEFIQIIPVCLIEHDGRFLANIRFEPDESLHESLSNWAGGHVRKQDQAANMSAWDAVLVGLKREIYEELSLAEWPEAPVEIGLVHTREDARAARHLGVVFRTHLQDAYTAAMLDQKVIRERPNKRVETSWKTAAELSKATHQKDWSLIIGRYLATCR